MGYSILTKYDKVYEHSCWNALSSENKCEDIIISNRNKFVEEFGIQKYMLPKKIEAIIDKLRDGAYRRYIDHIECYSNGSTYFIITSPYGSYENEDKFMSEVGFQKYNSLYYGDVNTYMKIVKKYKYNKNISSISGSIPKNTS